MDPKADLLVFGRKEVFVIIVLFILVALFSFTLGVRLGRSIGVPKAAEADRPPLTEQVAAAPATPADHDEDLSEHAEKTAVKPASPEAQAEDQADTKFVDEVKKEKVAIEKRVPMNLPHQKKAASAPSGKYTLQVGSFRTVGEAAERVSALKRQDLEAF